MIATNFRNRFATNGRRAAAWLAAGLIVSGLFAADQFPDLRFTTVVLAVLTVLGAASLRIAEVPVMARLFVVLYSLPFGACLGYLIDSDFTWVHAPNCAVLCQNHVLINQMLTMVIVGLCGLMAGLETVAAGAPRIEVAGLIRPMLRNLPTLTLSMAATLLIAAVVLSWMHAPSRTIFAAAYTGNIQTDLRASYLISYLLLILLYVDAEREPWRSRQRRIKSFALAAAVAYIVVVLQFLCGDRECSGLVTGLALLYITGPRRKAGPLAGPQPSRQVRRLWKLSIPLAGSVLMFMSLGSLRHAAGPPLPTEFRNQNVILDYATRNTWTAVARNNLGAATDYHYGTMESLQGQTYVEYLQSAPPLWLANLVGYSRPMDGPANPAMWYCCLVSNGGMHPVVVPFRNFGILGVLAVLFVCGVAIGACEIYNEQGTPFARLLYGCVGTSSVLWFWYGDMNLIRTVMVCGMLTILYVVAASWHRKSMRLVDPQSSAEPPCSATAPCPMPTRAA